MNDMRIAVTGGAGFIGSHVVDRLVCAGNEVMITDDFSTGRLENIEHHRTSSAVRIEQVDIRDWDAMACVLGGVDVVFHMAVACLRTSLQEPIDAFPIRDRVFAEYGPPFSFRIFERLHPGFSSERLDRAFKTVRTTSHKYILASDGSRELYGLTTDPRELENEATQSPQLAARLHQQLTDTLGGFSAPSCSEPTGGLSIEEEKPLVEHLRRPGYL